MMKPSSIVIVIVMVIVLLRGGGGGALGLLKAGDALHDSILPLTAGINAISAALSSFDVVAVSSWWGWYRRTVCG